MKLLVIGGGAAELRAARLGLGKQGWIISGVPVGSAAWQEPNELAQRILDENPDVVYSPTLFGGGRRILAAVELRGAARRPWLTSVSAFDFMADYQRPEVAEQVQRALLAADALLPLSARHDGLARSAGYCRTIFPPTRRFFEFDLGLIPAHGLGSPARRDIVVDGSHGLTGRGLVAIAGLRAAGADVAGRNVVVINADPDATIAAMVMGTDVGALVRTLPPAASTAQAVLGAQARALCSISLSLEPDLGTTEITALSEGALPIVSRSSALSGDLGSGVCREQVDPEDPQEIGEAVARVVADGSQRRFDRARNASAVRDWFDSEKPEMALAEAVRALAERD